MFDFVRVASAVPSVSVGGVEFNTEKIIEKIDEAAENKVNLVSFPELAVTGYTCGDLFFQNTLIEGAKKAVLKIAEKTREVGLVVVLGAPFVIDGRIFNCAAVISGGEVQGLVPKTFLPNYNEFSEKRWFASSESLKCDSVSAYDMGLCKDYDYEIPVGRDLVFRAGESLKFGVEICEDMWTPVSCGAVLALSGAELIVNISACGEIIGKREHRRTVVKAQSLKNISAYLYTSAGAGESTSDSIFTGETLVCENGAVLAEQNSLTNDGYLLISDLDMGKIKADRMKRTSFFDCADIFGADSRVIELDETPGSDGKLYKLKKTPFVPSGEKAYTRCIDTFKLQAAALARRLEATNARAVVGVSGGLDSTLALLVCAEAVKMLGRTPDNVLGVTMPGFGTTNNTKSNSIELMEALGVEIKTVPIKDACIQHFKDIGHDESVHNVVYENAQARERTQVLMDIANSVGGIVVGTGDLSEIALGWSTYNGDHMSMYAVNSGIPKTLIAPMIENIAKSKMFDGANAVLSSIVATPISPELLPPDENGEIVQKTEELVGPYELHDFFLYYAVRFGFSPSKIYYMARLAFSDEFNPETILKWLKNFYRRFVTQQFKRNCMPDGVKVGSVGLSPRGDWKMAADASYSLWLSEAENL